MAYSIDLSGRVAFITGASGGLGAQFARTLARAGAAVVLASRRVEKLKDLRAEIEALPAQLPLDRIACPHQLRQDVRHAPRRQCAGAIHERASFAISSPTRRTISLSSVCTEYWPTSWPVCVPGPLDGSAASL